MLHYIYHRVKLHKGFKSTPSTLILDGTRREKTRVAAATPKFNLVLNTSREFSSVVMSHMVEKKVQAGSEDESSDILEQRPELVVRVTSLLELGQVNAAVDAFILSLNRKEDISFPALIDLFLNLRGVECLKLLLEKRIYCLEVCSCKREPGSISHLVTRSCELGLFRHWEDFGSAFRDVVRQIVVKIPDPRREELICEIIAQVPPLNKARAYNAVIETTLERFNVGYTHIGESLLREMLNLGLRPSILAYRKGILFNTNKLVRAGIDSNLVLAQSEWLYQQGVSLSLRFSFKYHVKLLQGLLRRSTNNLSACIHIVNLAFELVERNLVLPASLGKDLLNRFEKVSIKGESGLGSVSGLSLDLRIERILKRLVPEHPIFFHKLFSVLLQCYSHVDPDQRILPETFLEKLHGMGMSPTKQHFEDVISLMGAFGDIDRLGGLLEAMIIKFPPDSKTLTCILSAFILADAPFKGIQVALSLLGREAVLDVDGYAVVLVAACLSLEMSLVREYFPRYLLASKEGSCRTDLCSKVIHGLYIFLNVKQLFWPIRAEALGYIDKIAEHVDDVPAEIHRLVIHSHAEFIITFLARRDATCLLPMLNAYRRWLSSASHSIDTYSYLKMLLALLNFSRVNPLESRRALAEADSLYRNMLRYKTNLTHQVFKRLILMATLSKDLSAAESYFQAFLAFYLTAPSPNADEMDQVLHVYAEICPLRKEIIRKVLDLAIQLGFKNLIHVSLVEYLILQDSPPEAVREMLNMNPTFSSADSVQLIALYFLQTEGPQAMLKAFSALSISSLDVLAAKSLYLTLITHLICPPSFFKEDPISAVAFFLVKLLAIPMDPTTRQEVCDSLWNLSDSFTPQVHPWRSWFRLRCILDLALDPSRPSPSLEDFDAL